MKNKTTKFLSVAMAIGVFTVAPPCIQAQAPKRIDWATEGRHLVWEAAVPAKSSRTYVFTARKGQKLSLSFVDDTGVGSMDLGKFSVEANTEPMRMPIEVSKDYTLTVLNNSNKATSFRIGFSLEDAKDSSRPTKSSARAVKAKAKASSTERIRFPQNSIEVNLEKSVPAKGVKRFVFAAQKGQEIAFTITPRSQDAKLTPNFAGKQVASGKLFTMIAPRTGDYQLQVTNSDTSVRSFTFDLGIDYPHKP